MQAEPVPLRAGDGVGKTEKRKSLLMQSLAEKYLTTADSPAEDVETTPEQEATKAQERRELLQKLKGKYVSCDVGATATPEGRRELLQSLKSKHLSCDELPEYVRKPKDLEKSEAELPMGRSKFDRIQSLLNVNLVECFQRPQPTTTPPQTPTTPDEKKVEIAPLEATFDKPPDTRELLGSFSKSRINANSHRKRRPPTRKPIHALFKSEEIDAIEIESVPSDAVESAQSDAIEDKVEEESSLLISIESSHISTVTDTNQIKDECAEVHVDKQVTPEINDIVKEVEQTIATSHIYLQKRRMTIYFLT